MMIGFPGESGKSIRKSPDFVGVNPIDNLFGIWS